MNISRMFYVERGESRKLENLLATLRFKLFKIILECSPRFGKVKGFTDHHAVRASVYPH
jgi:hypothetical protein